MFLRPQTVIRSVSFSGSAVCIALLAGAFAASAQTFPPVTSFSNSGPFSTTIDTPAGSGCTIYRPTTLGQNGLDHPVIIWGNGTGASPSSYNALLEHWASHGFIVAAANTSNAGNGSQMLNCLDTLTNLNNTSTSPYFHNVDLAHVGASGHSQGGAGTVMAGRDARITATAPVQPYIGFIPGGGRFRNASIGQQQGQMLLLSGSADSIAVPSRNQQPIFNGTNVHVFWATRNGASHFEPVGDGGDFRGPTTAWFRAHLMNDAAARDVFEGTCTLCGAAGWSIQIAN